MTEVSLTDEAIDDLRRIGPDAVPRVPRKLLMLLDDLKAGYPLGGELTGFRKLVIGRNTWRVVYRITDEGTIEICEVWAIGSRADAEVYAEATARVRDADVNQPLLHKLADVVERLGRLAGGVEVRMKVVIREPVPDWLAQRLVHTVGTAPEAVAALDLQQAVDTWTAFLTDPKGNA